MILSIFSAILAAGVVVAGSATGEMLSPEYWAASEEVLMTPAEIEKYNASLVGEGVLDLVDICSEDSVVSGEVVRKAIESYKIPAGYDYFDRERVTPERKTAILALRNLDAVPEKVNVRYGVVTTAADLRSFPTSITCTDDGIVSGSLCFDDFQQSTLWMGEGVQIWHKSVDGEWFFVRAENYAGWVRASQIGLCSRQEMVSYVRSPEFSVVLEQKYTEVAGVGMRLMMGTRLARAGRSTDGIYQSGEHVVLVPVRRPNGNLGTVECIVDVEMSDGYLPYTTAGVLRQAFKLLGTPYSWGNAGGYNDCSGTLLSVYYCFGIHLPRNSSSMRKMTRGNMGFDSGVGSGKVESNGKSEKNVRDVDWTSVQPGSPVILPGHAMMFLGVVDGEPYILHAVNAIYHKKSRERVVGSAGPVGSFSSFGSVDSASGTLYKQQCSTTLISSTSDIFRKTGLSFLDSFVNVIEIR